MTLPCGVEEPAMEAEQSEISVSDSSGLFELITPIGQNPVSDLISVWISGFIFKPVFGPVKVHLGGKSL